MTFLTLAYVEKIYVISFSLILSGTIWYEYQTKRKNKYRSREDSYNNHENTLKQGIYINVDIRNTQFTRFYKEDQVSSSADPLGNRTSIKNFNSDKRPKKLLCKMSPRGDTIMSANQNNLRSQEFLGRRCMSSPPSSLHILNRMEKIY